MPPSIFLSYRRSDSGGHAGRLYDRLSCWFAKDALFLDVSSIDWGDHFPEEIDRAVRGAQAVLIIVGPDWLQTINQRASKPDIDFVRREVSIALQRRRANEVEFLPLLVGGARLPSADDLHPDLKQEIGPLSDYNAHEFHADTGLWNFQFERLRQRLARVPGVPRPEAQFAEGGRALVLGFDQVSRMPHATAVDVQALREAFCSVSTTLLNWPQETDGQWIERPELDRLYELSCSAGPSITALLGGPGEGKSALLARLGVRLSDEGTILLAIKADQVPRRTATLRDLEDWIGADIPATTALRQLASDRRVVVLIDQLDALADLMDQHSERLTSLMRFVDAVRGIPNIAVLVSCREFEFRNDVRFNTLKADEVGLQRLTWEQVVPLVTARGLDTEGWSDEVRDVLRTPQSLAMFLDHLAGNDGEPLFSTYHGLFSRIIKERIESVHGPRTVEAAEHIATTMAFEEELWLGSDRFELQFGSDLQRLDEAGFLVRSGNGLSIAFRHQTLFDFLRARAFLRHQQSLTAFVVDQRQQSLFVRPILWSTLAYLRASDRAVYRHQFRALWTHTHLRPHIRNLMVHFLGQLADPDGQEAQWLLTGLREDALRPRILRATAGSPGWFTRLKSRLPGFMAVQPDKAWHVTGLLQRATSFEPDYVHRMVDRHWTSDKRYLPSALSVMQEFRKWDDSSVDLVCRLVGRTSEHTFHVRTIAGKISLSRPDLAPIVIVRHLEGKLGKLDADRPEPLRTSSHDSSVAEELDRPLRTRDRLKPYERLIDHASEWHRIEEIAQRAPRQFLEQIWPWLVELFTRLGRQGDPSQLRYREHNGLSFMRETSERQPLQTAIKVAARGFASTQGEDFLIFQARNKNTDLMVLHRLLALGLSEIAPSHPAAVLDYLLEDPRRFAMGDMNNDQSDSEELISAVAPALSEEDAKRLEDAVRNWHLYPHAPHSLDAKTRLALWKRMRKRRLRLLRLLPLDRLSREGRQHVSEEQRAVPDVSFLERRIRSGWIGSPMSGEQMEKATDDQILALFEELTDDTEWDHPRRRFTAMVGGSIQASREFAKFACAAPTRALKLIRRFIPEAMERPAGAALAELSKSSTTPEDLIACIHELDAKGFSSEPFRTDSARAAGELARRFHGLNDETCRLIERWIVNWQPETDEESEDTRADLAGGFPSREKVGEERQQSLLWDHWSDRTLPQGNYPFLNALMRGYLFREPGDVDGWLSVLERHLSRDEDPAVWREVAEDLWRLVAADRARAIRFLESFLRRCSSVLYTVTGVSLTAHLLSWLPAALLERIITDWISESWELGPQAAGEVLALKLCRHPDDTDARLRVEEIVSGDIHDPAVIDALRVGLTHTFAAAWSEAPLRVLATHFLARLATTESIAVHKALCDVFGKVDPLPADDHTRELLEVLLHRPAVLAGGGHFLIEGLKGLLRDGWEPMLVYQVTNALIAEKANDLGDVRTDWAADAGDLADIVLTLHRIPDTREVALDLFERLIDARSYGLEERIAAIDRPAFR